MTSFGAKALGLLVTIVLVSACGAATTSPPPASATPSVSIESPSESATTTPTPPSTASATPPYIVLSGTWVLPTADATLTSYTTTLAASPSGTGPGETTFTKVVFSATGPGAAKTVLCRAKVPDADYIWSCEADLLAKGVPPGEVSFTFDVYGEGVPAAMSPDGDRHVTYAVKPPAPTKTTWKRVGKPEASGEQIIDTYRATWSAPEGYADQFRLYDTSECPRASDPANAGTPCFVEGTSLDPSKLDLLAKASGDDRSVDVRLTEFECGPSYGSILLRAINKVGKSSFAIVESATVPDPSEVIC